MSPETPAMVAQPDKVTYEFDSETSWVTLNNATAGHVLDPQAVDELFVAVRRAARDRAKVIVLRANGPMFCAGGDIEGFASAPDVGDYVDSSAQAFHRVIAELHASDAIVVSVVHATAAGAGVGLAIAADIVLAGESASFLLGYTKLGFSVDGGASLMVHSIGLHRALRLMLLNDRISAAEAYSIGLVSQVTSDAELLDTAARVAARLARGPRAAQSAVKSLARNAADGAVVSALYNETIAVRQTAQSADGKAGVEAFLAKQRPRFTD